MGTEINYSQTTQNSPKKRVLFIITQSELGGAQRFLHTLVNHLDKTRYEMLIAAGPSEFRDKNYELLDQLGQEGFKTVRLKYLQRKIKPLFDLKALFEIKKLITSFKPDTLFLLSSKAGFLGSLVSRFMLHAPRFKTIYRIGGWSFNDPGPRWKKFIWTFAEKLSSKWKDIIIVNNSYDFNQAKNLKITPKRQVKLIYNGVDVYKMDLCKREDARLKLFEKASKQYRGVFNSDIIVGTVANFYLTKGLKYLVESAEHFQNDDRLIFVIIGEGSGSKELKDLIIQSGLDKKVLLLGQISNARQLIPAFDVFVLPSVKEGFPWAILEAMAAKLPIIATRVGAIPEIIEDGKNGMLIEPAHPEQIAKKLLELVNNGRLRQEMGIQAHQTVLFKFSLEKMVKEIESSIN